jgi:sarcosine oxidase subunit gamma
VDPASQARRSFVYRQLAAAGAVFDAAADGAVAAHYGNAEAGTETARRLGLADLSVLPRSGFKGAGTARWLAAQGVSLPEVNEAAVQQDGTLAARLGPEEVLLLGGLDGAAGQLDRLSEAWTNAGGDGPRGYPVPRRETHSWFLVTGGHAADMFAKLCAVDLRPQCFANHRIAQTSVARANAIVIRADLAQTLAYHLLVDSASADYFLPVLLDAMSEFGGGLVGYQALQALLQ